MATCRLAKARDLRGCVVGPRLCQQMRALRQVVRLRVLGHGAGKAGELVRCRTERPQRGNQVVRADPRIHTHMAEAMKTYPCRIRSVKTSAATSATETHRREGT